jgi:hypothetical protein
MGYHWFLTHICEVLMESVAVFTGKNIEIIRSEGGSGHWSVSVPRAQKAEFVVCVRNRRAQWSVTDLKHGTAFIIARASGKITESKHAGRSIIGLSEYAEIHVEGAWKKLTGGQRFPVAYLNTEDMLNKLGIKVDDLKWKPFEAEIPSEVVVKIAEQDDEDEVISPIIQAKQQLAKALGISPDTIEITIRA